MSFAVSGVAIQGFGLLTSAVGAYTSAQGQKTGLEASAAISAINARLAESSAQQELLRGQKEASRLKLRGGQIKAAQAAAQAANGVDLGVGSAAEVRASSEILKEIDANQIEANAVMSAWGYRVQGVNSQSEAAVRRSEASSISPLGSAASGLLTNAPRVADSWYALSTNGAL